jgi:hypothetical protein
MRWLILLAALSLPAPVLAQACLPRTVLVETLEQKYGEHLRMQAMTTPGPLLEMFVAPSGSWTIFVTQPDGMACPMFSGQGVEMVAQPEGDPA